MNTSDNCQESGDPSLYWITLDNREFNLPAKQIIVEVGRSWPAPKTIAVWIQLSITTNNKDRNETQWKRMRERQQQATWRLTQNVHGLEETPGKPHEAQSMSRIHNAPHQLTVLIARPTGCSPPTSHWLIGQTI